MNLVERYVMNLNMNKDDVDRYVWNNLINYTTDRTFGFNNEERVTVTLIFDIESYSKLTAICDYFNTMLYEDIEIRGPMKLTLCNAYVANSQVKHDNFLGNQRLELMLIGSHVEYKGGY